MSKVAYRLGHASPAVWHAAERGVTFSFNGTEVPIKGLEAVVSIDTIEGRHMDIDLTGELASHIDIGELGRMYADDPVIQAILSFVVRAELLYTLARIGVVTGTVK